VPKYSFEAKGIGGKDFKGEIDASNEAEARVKLRAQRLVPVKVTARGGSGGGGGGGVKKVSAGAVKAKDLQIFTRQLSTLLSSGIPILQSLETLGSGTRSPNLKLAMKEVVANVTKGRRFADSLTDHPKIFDKLYTNMVKAGEESGGLDKVLDRLAMYVEKSVRIQGKVKGALLYPAIIMVVAGGVIAGILIFVIPKFQDLFNSAGKELPGLTQMVVTASHFLTNYWYVIIAMLVGAYFGVKAYYQTPPGREQIDTIMINTPLFGDLIQKSAVARFSRTLGTLLSSGVGIMEALEIASKTVGNIVVEKAVLRARDAIAEGKSITVPLSKEKYIPSMVTQMIGVGEQTGNLDQMLNKIADFYEDEVDTAVGALTAAIEPLMMVFLGGIIAVLVIAMYLPIFNLAGAIGG
jgi:type IV pilus assembly protein PilC